METQVLMPQLGESVTEGTIAKWLIKPGDTVKKYEPLCEVTTDKVNAEVPSTVEGTVTELVAREGDTLAVGELICYIETRVGGAKATTAQPADMKETASETPAAESPKTNVALASKDNVVNSTAKAAGKRYSPAVMRLAQENNIDVTQIEGTGREGRITRKDVLAFIENGGMTARPAERPEPINQAEASTNVVNMESVPTPSVRPAVSTPEINAYPGDTEIPVTAIRKTIASRMVQSKHDAPHAWTMVEVDMTNLVKLRNSLKAEFKAKEGFNLTFMPFFIKAVVESIKEFPIMNSVWAGDKIVMRKNINISIAVATDDALFVPVIKDADQKSIYGLAHAVDELAAKTRQGKLSMDDMSGGTFTVNNTGSFGSVLSAPIINQPQAAIVSMESIVKRPVVIDDMIAIRDMANLCLSLDHRVLDGLVCGRFLQSVKQKLEAYGSHTTIY
ncbi:dihydrolipoamide acetyltransferase family protein [Aneurinibacillus migulanus]|uniref:Dihydrolipoamide acetyltransferase component of pyruvate dehydrogenase complex n=1 Tax=Aneurinibacillus migulanus TaxID=47500 RepID=A0A0D1XC77_ANEMI|nr:dihydrolipoamide acetyltransferase family protein [Aneurinibacillus migulanus]KIV51996.1 branched-chain alpha-keto acid dehydrogenase subunit E2 [Aneurinibacillus migulanus]KON98124.1 branched-chain alpha-keto acid dehydrogenase subunit E2 [Aneurinibacillus migulanus]MED0891403.1 dihydrolipoamide acetyltransferase family protein [Aneurinibacillus migulanus]MED1613908.1 dihydrolipoamide acetyltransferase family protein [Aneurinibacillus migulanus]SDI05273.1 2-oxoisovalerate dehydrogenase E2 